MVINLAFPLFVFDNSQNMKLYIWEKLILLPRGNTAHCSGSLILKCRKMLLNAELKSLFYINHPKHLKHWSNSSNVSSLDKKLDFVTLCLVTLSLVADPSWVSYNRLYTDKARRDLQIYTYFQYQGLNS